MSSGPTAPTTKDAMDVIPNSGGEQPVVAEDPKEGSKGEAQQPATASASDATMSSPPTENPAPAASDAPEPSSSSTSTPAVEASRQSTPAANNEATVPPSANTTGNSTPSGSANPPKPTSTAAPSSTAIAEASIPAKTTLPPGLTETSPSVMRESVAIEAHQQDPTNPHPILTLIASATSQNELDDVRAWYEAFLKLYPTAAPQYLSYIELELAHDNQAQVEALFSRAFAKNATSGPVFPLAYPPLWTAYLHYIRRQNPLPPLPPNTQTLPSNYLAARSVISKAYEFALAHVGLDSLATPIWLEFIQFVKEGETRTTWEEQAKVGELRKIYTSVLRVPIEDVEGIWRQYDMFEGSVNKVTAKKFLAERSPGYMTARSVLRELRSKLPTSASAFPAPLPHRPTWTDLDRSVVASWKAYIEWEVSNPLELEEKDEVQARVLYALRKAVGGEARFFPEIWFIASKYCQVWGKPEDAAGYLRSGIQANPSSFLLSFALAEFEEARKAFAVVHTIFTSLTSQLQTDLAQIRSSTVLEITSALAALDEKLAARAGQPQLAADGSEMDAAETKRSQDEEKRKVEEEIRERRGKDLEEGEKAAGLVWIMYMRSARRSEGIKSGRQVFSKARKFTGLAWQVYEASALMEYHCSKDPSVATRIFELGLKLFGEKIEFVDRYLAFLITINDDQNARVLFEKSVAKFAPDVARPLWERWARYEYLFGDLASAHRLDARFVETFAKDTATKNLARRHSYVGIDEIARIDLGFGAKGTPLPPIPSYKTNPNPDSTISSSSSSSNPGVPSVIPPTPTSNSTAPSSAYAQSPNGKRSAPSDPPAPPPSQFTRQPSIDRGERMSMRDQKRPRIASPVPAPAAPLPPHSSAASPSLTSMQPARRALDNGWGSKGGGRDAPPLQGGREKTPPVQGGRGDGGGGPSGPGTTGGGASLSWLVGLLPPAPAFDGPLFPTDQLMGILEGVNIQPIYPPPSNHGRGGSGGARRAGGGGGRANGW